VLCAGMLQRVVTRQEPSASSQGSAPGVPEGAGPAQSAREDESPAPFILSDDPADHGLSEGEVACIEKAYEIRRREARVALEQPSRLERDWGLSGMGWPEMSSRPAGWMH